MIRHHLLVCRIPAFLRDDEKHPFQTHHALSYQVDACLVFYICHHLIVADTLFVSFAVPGEGTGHRVTPDHEKDKGCTGSQQHHESREADPASRLHMTLQAARHLTGWITGGIFTSGFGWLKPWSQKA